MNLNVYQGVKAVKKVKSITDLEDGSNLGVLPFGVTVLLSKSHVEFTVALEAKRGNDVVWLGYYFSGSFLKFQKIFKKLSENSTYELISSIVHKSLIGKVTDDPYSSSLYITGHNDSRAYWTVTYQNNIVAHIPLHRADTFHTLQSYPVIYVENDIQILIGGDLDRNQLYPSYPKVDTLYTQSLYNIDNIFTQSRWSVTIIPKSSSSDNNNSNHNAEYINAKNLLCKNQFDLEKLSRLFLKKFNSPQPLTFAYGVTLYRKGTHKTMDLLTLKTLQTGKTFIVNLVNTFKLTPNLDYFKDQEQQKKYENDHIDQYKINFQELENDCKTIKTLFPSNSHLPSTPTSPSTPAIPAPSVSIYNPFFDKYCKKALNDSAPVTLESSFLSSNQSLQSYFNSGPNTPSSGPNTPHSVVVDPIPLSSSNPSVLPPSSSSTPYISISGSSSPSENIFDKLKILDKKIQQQKEQSTNESINVDKLAKIISNIFVNDENYKIK